MFFTFTWEISWTAELVDNISVWCYSCSVQEDLIFYKKITSFTVEKGRRSLNQILHFLVTWHNKALRKQYKAGEGSVTPSRYTAWGSEDPSSTSPSDPVQETPPLPPSHKMPQMSGTPAEPLSPKSSPNPNLKAGETCTSSSIPELCNSAHQNPRACISICYLLYYLLSRRATSAWLLKHHHWEQQAGSIHRRLASASWQSWQPQPVACWWRLRTFGISHLMSSSTCSGVTAHFGFAFCLTWQSKIQYQDAAFMFMKLQDGFLGNEAATLLEVTSHLNKVGHLQERNALVFHVILLLELNNSTLTF